jgi:hypothetical protein
VLTSADPGFLWKALAAFAAAVQMVGEVLAEEEEAA